MIFVIYLVSIFYFEIIYKLLTSSNINESLIVALLYWAAIAAFLSLITGLIPKKIKKHFIRIIIFIITFWYGASIIVKRTFGIVISITATGMADQFVGGGFISLLIDVLKQNWYVIILVFVPFLFCIVFFILYKKRIKRGIIKDVCIMIVSILLFICSIFFLNINNFELKELYLSRRNNSLNVDYFGVMPSLLIDIRKEITGFEEKIIVSRKNEFEEDTSSDDKIKSYFKQISSFDFSSLANNEEDKSIKQIHLFMSQENPTLTNQYTGLYEGKNLIYIMAEAFSGFAVSKELTPTLYKMIHDGFYFENFYSTTNLSTIGGEFQELTGLIPDLQCLSWKWRESNNAVNYYPYALGTLFKNLGYTTYAYHNHDYTFQDRNKYLKTLGFDNFIGCGNGIEDKGVNCKIFPESDDEMILGTYTDFINDEHFMVYYATVSGHMGWDFNENHMSIKHKNEVENIEASEKVKAFIAASLELESAMKDLLRVLEENNRLDDTVIVLSADHHPYGMNNDELNELANKQLDPTFEIYKNNLIIYNSSTEKTPISKVCGSIDVLPTTLNLFNIPFDSRLIIGKDILSSSDGLVIFGDGSWLTNKGKYDIKTGKFSSKNNENVDDNYVEKMKRLASNRILISKNIMYYDYYRKLFKK